MEENLSFEQAIKRLEQVVREMETGDLPLDQSLALFQEGVMLAQRCGLLLDSAEARIEKLLEKNGEAVTVPFEVE